MSKVSSVDFTVRRGTRGQARLHALKLIRKCQGKSNKPRGGKA